MNPYRLESPAVVSFSGGRTSGMMLWHVLQAFGGTLPEDVKVVFCNTGKERPETLDFVERCSQEWGVDVVWLEYRHTPDAAKKHSFAAVNYATASRNGEPFAELIKVRNFLPNPVSRFCTQELKIRPLDKYLISIGWSHWESAVGIRADEPHRLSKARNAKVARRSEVIHPLAKAGVTLSDVERFWGGNSFDLQLMPHEGNCDLCFLKGAGRIRRVMADRPDLAEWWIDMEQLIMKPSGETDQFRRDRPRYRVQLELAHRPTLFTMDEPDELSIACHCTD